MRNPLMIQAFDLIMPMCEIVTLIQLVRLVKIKKREGQKNGFLFISKIEA